MTSVFKFMSDNNIDCKAATNRNLESIKESYLWFSELNNLNDPYEGAYHLDVSGLDEKLLFEYHRKTLAEKPLDNLSVDDEVLEKYLYEENKKLGGYRRFIISKIKEKLNEGLKKLTSEYSVYSLSESRNDGTNYPPPLNNMSMWGYYANGLRGFCIEFDIELLVNSLGGSIGRRKINYSKEKLPVVSVYQAIDDQLKGTSETNDSLINALMTKSASPWEMENEFRLITRKPEGKIGYSPVAIKRVFIGKEMETPLKEELIKIVRGLNSKIPICEVAINVDQKSYGFDYSTI